VQHPNFSHHPLSPRKSKRSEYLDEMRADGSGFMTQKEKDWVIRIQLLQLQTTDPENEDYYYQVLLFGNVSFKRVFRRFCRCRV
jgi:DNA topoisomerase 2-associated protein PAT1